MTHLRGGDINNPLVNNFVKEFKQNHRNDISKDKYALICSLWNLLNANMSNANVETIPYPLIIFGLYVALMTELTSYASITVLLSLTSFVFALMTELTSYASITVLLSLKLKYLH